MNIWFKFEGFRVRISKVSVMVRVKVSPQEMNVSLRNVPTSDGHKDV